MVFAVRQTSAGALHPLVLTRSRLTGWKAWEFEGDSLQRLGWKYVGQTVDRKVLFAVLDSEAESPSWDLEIIRSDDYGRSWVPTGRIRKPYFYAVLSNVSMHTGGDGTITVLLDEDYGTGDPAGYYHYSTNDGGRSWSDPTYSPRHNNELLELHRRCRHHSLYSSADLKAL